MRNFFFFRPNDLQRQLRLQKERLTDEYTAALNMFQSTQRDALRKESIQVKKKRAEMNSNSFGMLPMRGYSKEELAAAVSVLMSGV